MIENQRVMPVGWTIMGGPTNFSKQSEEIDGWYIAVSDNRPFRNDLHTVRERFLKAANVAPQRALEQDPAGMPLAAAIHEFNAAHWQIDGKRQPPLTEDEVVAAIVHWKWHRNKASVINKDFAAFQEIAKTRMLPKGAALELLSQFSSSDGQSCSIWSVRIRMPQSNRVGWTYAYVIRKQFISLVHPRLPAAAPTGMDEPRLPPVVRPPVVRAP